MSSITPAQQRAPAPPPTAYLAFNLGSDEYGVDINERIVGMVVDSVSDVTTLAPDHIKPAPPCRVRSTPAT